MEGLIRAMGEITAMILHLVETLICPYPNVTLAMMIICFCLGYYLRSRSRKRPRGSVPVDREHFSESAIAEFEQYVQNFGQGNDQ